MAYSIKSVKQYLLAVIFIVSMIPVYGYSQDTEADPPKKTSVKKTVKTEHLPDKKIKASKKKLEAHKRNDDAGTVRKADVRIPENKNDSPQVDSIEKVNDGLLEINDGSYLYKRIPEIKIEDKGQPASEDFEEEYSEKKIGEETKTDADAIEKKGLFGLGKKSTGIMAKIVLILIILVIFALYKTRSREGRSNVLRRFPKG